MSSKSLIGLWLFLWVIALQSCASVEAPSGGPVDKEPPRVTAVSPAPRAINSSRELDVRLQFSEWIMNPVPRNAIRISPPLDGRLETEVDGDVLILTSKAKLDTLTTYTINVGSVLEDLHKNPVARPFQLVFSTGPQVDTLQIRGTVLLPDSLLRKKVFPTVGLFPIGMDARTKRQYLAKLFDSTKVRTDTLPLLMREAPLYISQTDSLGRFKMEGLAPGKYRVAAFLDLNGDNRIDASTEIAGLAESDLSLDTAFRDSFFLTLSNLDTAHPQLISASVISPLAISLEHTRPYKIDSTTKACGLWKADTSLLSLAKAYWIAPDTKKLILAFDSAKADSTYLVGCDTLQRIRMRWLVPKDSLSQRIASFKLLGPSPATDSLPSMEVAYNIPLRIDTLAPKLALLANKDTLPVIAKQIDPVRIQVTPVKPLSMGIAYKLTSIYRDTATKLPIVKNIGSFETVSALKLSRIQGRVRNANQNTRVRLRSPSQSYVWTTQCGARGEFRLERIPEGPYLMDYFMDMDQDSLPSSGNLSPYRAAEAWRPVPDTLHIGQDFMPTTLDSILFSYPLPIRNP